MKRGSHHRFKSKRHPHKRRRRFTCKGGMHRAISGRKFINELFGKTWPERLEKLNQMKDAALKGAADAAKSGHNALSESRKSFDEFKPTEPFHISHVENPATPTIHQTEYHYSQTPKKPTSIGQPSLKTRAKLAETPNTRVQRLAFIAVPTAEHPVSVVKTLEFEN